MNIDDLRKPFDPKLISWRVGATNKKKNNGVATKGIALAYIDARDVMQRLDDVCGIGNWQNKHPHANGKTSCAIGIKINDEWVWKENGAGDSDTEAEKGAFSDSFKRAAVLWGIGRYLYDVPNIWVEVDEWGAIKNKNDPKLIQALENAAKGIRGVSEPEPDTKPKTKEEKKAEAIKTYGQETIETYELITDAINSSITEKQIDNIIKVRANDIDKMHEQVRAWIAKSAYNKRLALCTINAG